MAGSSSDYHRGDMDIAEQKATFRTVMGATKWASLVVAVGVMFATLLFCTAAGFGGALITAIVVAAIGGFALREKPAPAH
jgi:hypothetical protein